MKNRYTIVFFIFIGMFVFIIVTNRWIAKNFENSTKTNANIKSIEVATSQAKKIIGNKKINVHPFAIQRPENEFDPLAPIKKTTVKKPTEVRKKPARTEYEMPEDEPILVQ